MDIDNKKGVSASHADTAQQIHNVKTPTSSESRSYEHSHTKNISQSKKGRLFKMKDEKFGSQTAKVFTFKDNMVVKIYTGSIVRFQGDALICSNDYGMSGNGPLAKAVAAAGGSKYNESYSKMRKKFQYGSHKWKIGEVETCSGGELNVRFVVHAVIQSMIGTDQENLKSYRSTLMKIFYTINSYNKSTKFAMPLIGAETTEKQPVEGRGLGARAKTGMSKSMYGKYPSGGATGFDRKYRYTGDSGHLTEAKSSRDGQSMMKGTEGNQPPGVISVEKEGRSLPGYENCGTIIVKYNFKSGIQGLEHPNPGQPYEGTERRGFLPDNKEGQKVQRLLKKAFDRRLVFTIGYSRTTGKDNVVTWNDIHHKTKRDTGAQRFGYPDPTYLQRVQEELAVKGVTE
uniref:E3 ubiquitin-protein ligase n=1 Tax=Magallana gigas TaxID=29159 RepID=K1QYY2_MAGGI